ncbi:MAG: aminotransferase class III-fold pyridoxal phosphate-dependent enzyme, partial [candidate division KSB1 bacterium]|nr:aminotransferase class III-fold pyridoxal phosphate-dependent enzyme [candidate division KSB1 bacterium]
RVFQRADVCAVIIEGIQGIGGIREPGAEFLQEVQALCRRAGAMLILDEVQSGCGRTGKFFAHQFAGIQPDLITIAKGMGNGFPVAGVLIHPRFKAAHGLLGTTFGGNPLACAAALAVLEVMAAENLIENSRVVGAYLLENLRQIADRVREVRGRGLMIGLELDFPSAGLRKQLLFQHHIFTGSAHDPHVIRLLPPLTLTRAHAQHFLEHFTAALQEV